MEIWKPVRRFRKSYIVSSNGQVKSLERTIKIRHPSGTVYSYYIREKILKPKKADAWREYLEVGMSIKGRSRNYYIHQLVLEAFVGPCPPGMECRHLDGDPSNNKLSNLAWGTPQENANDRISHGTTNKGKKKTYGRYQTLPISKDRHSQNPKVQRESIAC